MTAPRTGGGTRPPVVLLHALALDATMWRAQQHALTTRGHRVLAPHQRGFGGRALGSEPPSVDLLADDLRRAMDGHGVRRAVLAGVSMGGYVAMAFARRWPDRVLGLGLVSSRAAADDAAAREGRLAFAAAMGDPAAAPAWAAAAADRLFGATTRDRRPQVAAELRAAGVAAPPESVAWAQRAIAGRPDSGPHLAGLTVPALVAVGEEDSLVTVGEAEATARCLPGARLAVVPTSGHLPPLETPHTLTALLADLLDEVAGTSRVPVPGAAHRTLVTVRQEDLPC
ncbi:alpha/beta fold hydrolase [Streptomyces sp. NRRL F-5123]|uniref:alpha/beta fold hydrolase n=1 Tax=Streptomyces sp. NRRL F-5123 TaxID=1463856 RepID=UPI0007C4B346|nr:alpha/beta hydrolase [Streptomyces sp. NRRL F-5123]